MIPAPLRTRALCAEPEVKPNKSHRETVDSHKAQRLAVFPHVLKEAEVRKPHSLVRGFTKNKSLKLNLTKELFS